MPVNNSNEVGNLTSRIGKMKIYTYKKSTTLLIFNRHFLFYFDEIEDKNEVLLLLGLNVMMPIKQKVS